jgi:hypothetical protein
VKIALTTLVGALAWVLGLAFAVYVYPSFPHLLNGVCVLIWLGIFLGAVGVTASWAYSEKEKKEALGFWGGLGLLVSIWLASHWMLYLGKKWSIKIDPEGSVTYGLYVLDDILGYVGRFLDALLQAIFGTDYSPVGRFFDDLGAGLNPKLDLPSVDGVASWSARFIGNVLLGTLSGIISAFVLSRWAARKKGNHVRSSPDP